MVFPQCSVLHYCGYKSLQSECHCLNRVGDGRTLPGFLLLLLWWLFWFVFSFFVLFCFLFVCLLFIVFGGCFVGHIFRAQHPCESRGARP